MLSTTQATPPQDFTLNGSTYRRCGQHRITYHTQSGTDSLSTDLDISLADRGCNGGFLGEDACILYTIPNAFADIVGMNNSLVEKAPLGIGALKINTMEGPIIGIFNQYALSGKGHTIHSVLQMEAFELTVEDK